jgi:hypothetical protein
MGTGSVRPGQSSRGEIGGHLKMVRSYNPASANVFTMWRLSQHKENFQFHLYFIFQCINSVNFPPKTTQAMYYNVTLRGVRANTVVVEKQSVTYSECVSVALGIQHAMLVRHIVICGLSGSTTFFHIIS